MVEWRGIGRWYMTVCCSTRRPGDVMPQLACVVAGICEGDEQLPIARFLFQGASHNDQSPLCYYHDGHSGGNKHMACQRVFFYHQLTIGGGWGVYSNDGMRQHLQRGMRVIPSHEEKQSPTHKKGEWKIM
jgi:hypothetical protein